MPRQFQEGRYRDDRVYSPPQKTADLYAILADQERAKADSIQKISKSVVKIVGNIGAYYGNKAGKAAGGQLTAKLHEFQQNRNSMQGFLARDPSVSPPGTDQQLERDPAQPASSVTGTGVQAPKLRKMLDPYSQSYNQAVLEAHTAALDVDMRDNLQRIADQSPTNVAQYDAMVNGYATGLLEQTSPALRQKVQYELDTRALSYRARIVAAEREANLRTAQATVAENTQALREEALQSARDGNIDQYQVTAQKFRDTIAANTRSAANPYAAIDPVDAQRILSETDEDLKVELYAGGLEQEARTNGIVAAQAYVDDFAGRPVAETHLSPQVRDRLLTRLRSSLNDIRNRNVEDAAGSIVAAYRGDTISGDAALARLDHSDMGESAKADIRQSVRAQLGVLYAERAREYVGDVAALDQSIGAGTPAKDAEQQALRLYRKGAFSPDEYTTRIQAIAQARQQQAVRTAESEAVVDALARGERLDPKSRTHQKYVDSALDERALAMDAPRGSAAWQAAALDLTTKTGIMPSQAQSWVRGAAMSPAPEVAAASASFIDTVAERAPQTLEYLDGDTKAFGLQVSQMMDAGTPAELAVETVRKNVYETKANERSALDARYKEQTKNSAGMLKSMLNSDDAYDPTVFGSAPPVPAGMQGDFDALTRQYFTVNGGNLGGARQMAYRDLQSRWGRTEANGEPQIMKYPPERFGIPPELVRQEMREHFGARADRLHIVPDADTGRAMIDPESGEVLPVSYAIVEIDPKTGFLNVLPDRYTLPLQSDIDDRVREERKRRVDQARRQSEAEEAKAHAIVEDAKRLQFGSAMQHEMKALRSLRPAEVK